jgi:hypothetical protein
VTIQPSQDNSIYSESNNSNALGDLFVGTTNRGAVRRALLEFDLAASGIPSGSIISAITLSLVQTKTVAAGGASFELHPLLSSWGSGSSIGRGQGDAPTTGDATWNYSSYSTSEWTSAGGDFGETSATTTFSNLDTTYSFSSTSSLVADVQGWLDTPGSNYGWILKAANESGNSSRELGSLESSLSLQPSLAITYTAVPEPGGLFGVAAILLLLGKLTARSRQEPLS